jgi:hypothetical protein
MANLLCIFNLGKCRTDVADGEEEFGIAVAAGSIMSPVHGIAPIRRGYPRIVQAGLVANPQVLSDFS